jgi:hypothetical protein
VVDDDRGLVVVDSNGLAVDVVGFGGSTVVLSSAFGAVVEVVA